jgi:hypothetical protein
MATSFTDILGHFFGDTGFTVTATIGGVDYTAVRMMRDDSRAILPAGESDDAAMDLLVKVSDVAVTPGTAVTIDSVVYRVKTVHKDGANLTQRCALVEQYG